eukprot:1158296-Pelagomonas_calceolata.AAC.1
MLRNDSKLLELADSNSTSLTWNPGRANPGALGPIVMGLAHQSKGKGWMASCIRPTTESFHSIVFEVMFFGYKDSRAREMTQLVQWVVRNGDFVVKK